MKIAYSCNGEGFGHVSRLATLLPHLEESHQVGLFLPRSVVAFLTGKVGPRPSVPIPGLHFVHRGDRILAKESFLKGLPVALAFPFTVARLARKLRADGYQAVICDFEPHLAWAGKLAGLPVFQLNHPGIMTRVRDHGLLPWLSALGARMMEGPWDERILVSFFQGDVGPLLRPALRRREPRNRGTIVVNLKPSYRAPVLEVLARYPGWKWRVFPAPGQNFDTALLDCTAVISPAGHQVLAEALALGKPILALPQEGQPEQHLNAVKLLATGRGRIGSLATFERDLAAFLADLPRLRKAGPLPAGYNLQDGTPALLSRLERFLTAKAPAVRTAV
jgi:UDP:flavonoid glycosyltransferase YjiC (YdhE family)